MSDAIQVTGLVPQTAVYEGHRQPENSGCPEAGSLTCSTLTDGERQRKQGCPKGEWTYSDDVGAVCCENGATQFARHGCSRVDPEVCPSIGQSDGGAAVVTDNDDNVQYMDRSDCTSFPHGCPQIRCTYSVSDFLTDDDVKIFEDSFDRITKPIDYDNKLQYNALLKAYCLSDLRQANSAYCQADGEPKPDALVPEDEDQNDNNPAAPPSSGLSTGAVVAIVGGGLLVVGLIALLVYMGSKAPQPAATALVKPAAPVAPAAHPASATSPHS